MTQLFNSTFELSLRVLLTLSIQKKSEQSIDELATGDFITTYNKTFGLSPSNLHGDNELSFTEFALRRHLISKATFQLVREGLLEVVQSPNGFKYSISSEGVSYIQRIQSNYARDYRLAAQRAQNYMKTKSEAELLNLISQEASNVLKRRSQ